MANTKSAEKNARKAKRNTVRNRARVSRVRSSVKNVETAIASGDKEAARKALKTAEPELARGAKAGVVHGNTVARKVSRLSARIKAM